MELEVWSSLLGCSYDEWSWGWLFLGRDLSMNMMKNEIGACLSLRILCFVMNLSASLFAEARSSS